MSVKNESSSNYFDPNNNTDKKNVIKTEMDVHQTKCSGKINSHFPKKKKGCSVTENHKKYSNNEVMPPPVKVEKKTTQLPPLDQTKIDTFVVENLPANFTVKTLLQSPSKTKRAGKKGVATTKTAPQRRSNSTPNSRSAEFMRNFLVVRRSDRLCAPTSKQSAEERERGLERSVRTQCEEGLAVVRTELKGRGVIATRFFQKDSFIVEYAGDLLEEKEGRTRENEYNSNPTIGCYVYYFQHRQKKWCVDATAESGRLGRLLNHSRSTPNCVTRVIEVDSQPRLIILAKHDILPGEELLYDYGDRDKATLLANPWLKT